MSIKSGIVIKSNYNFDIGGFVKNILLILFSVVLAVLGQFFLKKGMLQIGEVPLNITTPIFLLGKVFKSFGLFLGFFLFALSSIVWLVVLSRVELSLAYPMVSMGYILTIFISWKFLGEEISALRWLAVAIISIGVFVLSKS